MKSLRTIIYQNPPFNLKTYYFCSAMGKTRQGGAAFMGLSRVMRSGPINVGFFCYAAAYKGCNPEAEWREVAQAFIDRFNVKEDVDEDGLLRQMWVNTAAFMEEGF